MGDGAGRLRGTHAGILPLCYDHHRPSPSNMRAATPATILVLAACIVLVLVTCSTPVIKSFAFLNATIGGSGSESGQSASLGCLGYCIGDTCKGPTIGYSFDPTQLLGVATSVEGYQVDSSKYTTAIIRGLTYALVLNPIALAACVVTLVTGILAHCGDCSVGCINGVFAGLASGLAFVATAINFVLFVLAKKRIDSVQGASASYGAALWLSLVGWVLIVLSSCAFCCSCCGGGGRKGRRKSLRDEATHDDGAWKAPTSTAGSRNQYADQMRMDALRAESDRKRKTRDLPKFATFETEHVEALPLNHDYDDSFAANKGHGGAGYGYAYGDESSFSHHANTPAYIAGVGPGAPRTPGVEPAATAYYDSSNNLAGHGAHSVRSPAPVGGHMDGTAYADGLHDGDMLAPAADDYMYADSGAYPSTASNRQAYGVHDNANEFGQPYDDGTHQQSSYPGQAHVYNEQSTYPGQASRYASEGGQIVQSPVEDAGYGYGTTGYNTHDQSYGGGQQSESQSRRLPTLPHNESSDQYPSEIMYTPAGEKSGVTGDHGLRGTSFGASHVPPPRRQTGDDGFGEAVMSSPRSPNPHGAYDYGNQNQQMYSTSHYAHDPPRYS